jgi:hypothetical protein
MLTLLNNLWHKIPGVTAEQPMLDRVVKHVDRERRLLSDRRRKVAEAAEIEKASQAYWARIKREEAIIALARLYPHATALEITTSVDMGVSLHLLLKDVEIRGALAQRGHSPLH